MLVENKSRKIGCKIKYPYILCFLFVGFEEEDPLKMDYESDLEDEADNSKDSQVNLLIIYIVYNEVLVKLLFTAVC